MRNRVTQRRRMFLRAAQLIAEGKQHYIAERAVPDRGAMIRLRAFAGDVIWFDDDGGLVPTKQTRHERVVFLCFAAVAA